MSADGQGPAPGGAGAAGSDDAPPKVTRRIAAEAAVWVARLHGPSRTRTMELDCLAWQARSAAHRHAFERCTETWMDVPGATVNRTSVPPPPDGLHQKDVFDDRPKPAQRRGRLVLALGLVGVAAAVGLHQWHNEKDFRTGVGESQTVVLDDGTRMSLNTDTRVRVDIGTKQRTVTLTGGEAAFEVAKDVRRPFVVRAAGSEVVALGTTFAVRLTPHVSGGGESLAVTLIEGQVALRPTADGGADDVAPAEPVLMRAGDRVRLAKPAGSGAPTTQRVDRPQLEQAMAWKRNEAVFDKATLSEAVAEMNRYSRTPLVLMGDLAQADWQVSGQFRTGDSVGFANAVAAVHGLVVKEQPGRLELARKP